MSNPAALAEGEKILVVDDDARLRRLLERFLDEQGYRVRAVENTEQMDRLLSRELFQLVVLDLMLPGEDGLTACRRLREQNNQVPIIMLTAKGDEGSRIQGLELGADDYLGKPFSPRELLARIKALLRRAQFTQVRGGDVLAFEDWRLDTVSHRLFHEDGEFFLSGADFALLKLFLDHPQQILDRDTIANATRGREVLPLERIVDMAVSRLRQRLRDTGKAPRLIQTVRGSGYLLAAQVRPHLQP